MVQRVRVLVSGVLVAAGMLGAVAPAMAQVTAIPVEIREGTCDGSGDMVAQVTDIPRTTGAFIGSPDTLVAEGDFATVPMALQELTDIPHALVVLDDVGGDMVACGGIGGVVNADGAVIFGLAEEQNSGVTGIAYFAPSSDGAQTDISVFVAGEFLPGDRQFDGGQAQGQVGQQTQPVPTTVPDAPAVVEQGLTADEQAYLDEVLPIVDTVSASLDETGLLFENPRFGEDDWTIQVVSQFVTWDLAYEQASAMTPPPAFASIHALFVEALSLLSSAGDDVVLGLDTLDAALIEQGANKIVQAGDLMIQASEELDQLRLERGL